MEDRSLMSIRVVADMSARNAQRVVDVRMKGLHFCSLGVGLVPEVLRDVFVELVFDKASNVVVDALLYPHLDLTGS